MRGGGVEVKHCLIIFLYKIVHMIETDMLQKIRLRGKREKLDHCQKYEASCKVIAI